MAKRIKTKRNKTKRNKTKRNKRQSRSLKVCKKLRHFYLGGEMTDERYCNEEIDRQWRNSSEKPSQLSRDERMKFCLMARQNQIDRNYTMRGVKPPGKSWF